MSPLKYIYYFLLISGLLLLLVRSNKLDSILLFFIPIYIFNLVTEFVSDSFSIYYPYHINQTLGCYLLYCYYYKLFQTTKARIFVITGVIVYSIFFAYYFVYKSKNFYIFNPADFVVEGIFVSIFAVLYLIKLYQSNHAVILKKEAHFWISIANLFFFSGCIFFMGFLNYLREHQKDLYHQLVYISYFLNLMLYLLYIKAFTCSPQPKKLSSQ